MNVVDASGWLEYFHDGPNAPFFAPAVEDVGRLLVPTVALFEVFRATLARAGEGAALEAVAQMRQGHVRELDEAVALRAAKLGFELDLPIARSLVLATAQLHGARLWTQDDRLRGVPGVRFHAATNVSMSLL